MLFVPWPLTSVPDPGIVHWTEAALAGIADNVYVYTLFGQKAAWITSITPGVAGFSLLIDSDLTPLVPQPFVELTVTEPLVNPKG